MSDYFYHHVDDRFTAWTRCGRSSDDVLTMLDDDSPRPEWSAWAPCLECFPTGDAAAPPAGASAPRGTP